LGDVNLEHSPPKKKSRTGGSQKGFVHNEITAVNAKQVKCNHCGVVVSSSNVTTIKQHLINLKVCCFLRSPQAAASKDPEVKSLAEQQQQKNTLINSVAASGA
jgi:hypothetical protein